MELIKCDSSMLGGMPAKLNDIEFLQNGISDALAGLASAHQLGNTFILDGVITSIGAFSTLHNTSGYAVVDGEICKVESSGLGSGNVVSSGFIYLEKVVTYNSDGLKVFKDTTLRDTYMVTKARFHWYSTVQSGKLLWTEVPRLNNQWITLDTDWDEAATLANPLKRTRYRKAIDGCIEIDFRLYNNPDSTSNAYSTETQIAELPVGFRPDRAHRFILHIETPDSLNFWHKGSIHFRLDTDGKLYFIPLLALDEAATYTNQIVNGASVWLGLIRIPLSLT